MEEGDGEGRWGVYFDLRGYLVPELWEGKGSVWKRLAAVLSLLLLIC